MIISGIMNDIQNHPYGLIKRLSKKHKEAEFSVAIYSISYDNDDYLIDFDYREIIDGLSYDYFRSDKAIYLAESSSSGLELGDRYLGILSDVVIGNKNYFIPMIDLCCKDLPDNIDRIIEEVDAAPATIYKSGESYHIYFECIRDISDYNIFIGSLIQIENRNPGLVDMWWLSGRLKEGHLCLRWTSGDKKSNLPKKVRTLVHP